MFTKFFKFLLVTLFLIFSLSLVYPSLVKSAPEAPPPNIPIDTGVIPPHETPGTSQDPNNCLNDPDFAGLISVDAIKGKIIFDEKTKSILTDSDFANKADDFKLHLYYLLTDKDNIDLKDGVDTTTYADYGYTLNKNGNGYQASSGCSGGFLIGKKYTLKISSSISDVNCSNLKESGAGALHPAAYLTNVCTIWATGTTTFSINKDGTVVIYNTDERVKADNIKIDNNKIIDGINIVVRTRIDSPLSRALAEAIRWLVDFINTTVTTLSGWINAVLQKADLSNVLEPWHTIRDIVLTLLGLGILIIAFANVLSIDIEQYGLARMIPKLVIGVILTYFSFLIGKTMLEIANVLQTQFFASISALPHKGTLSYVKEFQLKLPEDASDIVGQLGTILFLVALFIGVVIVLIYLTIVLLARIIAIKFLVIVAPIAFILGIMPFTESLQKKWWSEFSKWVYMGPAVAGLLLVGAIITQNTPVEVGTTTGPGQLNALDGMIGVATAAVAYFFAASIPSMMGGKIMADVGKKVKGGMKWAGKNMPVTGGAYKTGSAMLAQRGKKKDQDIQKSAQRWRERFSKVPAVGKWATGMSHEERRGIISERSKNLKNVASGMGFEDKKDFALGKYSGPNKQIRTLQRDKLNQEAMAMTLGEDGFLGDKEHWAKWGAQYGQTANMDKKRPELTRGWENVPYGEMTRESAGNLGSDLWKGINNTDMVTIKDKHPVTGAPRVRTMNKLQHFAEKVNLDVLSGAADVKNKATIGQRQELFRKLEEAHNAGYLTSNPEAERFYGDLTSGALAGTNYKYDPATKTVIR